MKGTCKEVADTAIALMKDGTDYPNKPKIIMAIDMVEQEDFSWDGLDAEFKEWDDLFDKAHSIIYQ